VSRSADQEKRDTENRATRAAGTGFRTKPSSASPIELNILKLRLTEAASSIHATTTFAYPSAARTCGQRRRCDGCSRQHAAEEPRTACGQGAEPRAHRPHGRQCSDCGGQNGPMPTRNTQGDETGKQVTSRAERRCEVSGDARDVRRSDPEVLEPGVASDGRSPEAPVTFRGLERSRCDSSFGSVPQPQINHPLEMASAFTGPPDASLSTIDLELFG